VTMAHCAATLLDTRCDAAALRRCEKALLTRPSAAFHHLVKVRVRAKRWWKHRR
jgi:hypothetical protein